MIITYLQKLQAQLFRKNLQKIFGLVVFEPVKINYLNTA